MAAKIFLAHAREDKPQVRKLYADLKVRGLDPWLDEKDLRAGQIWKVEIPKAIREARLFLACLSSRSVGKSGYVQIELREALAAFGERPPGSIYVIPLRLDECEVPDLRIPNLGLSLQDIHWVDLWQDGGFEQLVSDLQHALGGATPLEASREEALTPIPPSEQEAEHRGSKGHCLGARLVGIGRFGMGVSNNTWFGQGCEPARRAGKDATGGASGPGSAVRDTGSVWLLLIHRALP